MLICEKRLRTFPKTFAASNLRAARTRRGNCWNTSALPSGTSLSSAAQPNIKSPKWPDEYWPKTEAPPSDKAWDKSVKQVLADLEATHKLIADPKRELTASIPHGDGQTLLREALLVADHNAYHLGQLVMVRRILERK